jgi:hypothetical protein
LSFSSTTCPSILASASYQRRATERFQLAPQRPCNPLPSASGSCFIISSLTASRSNCLPSSVKTGAFSIMCCMCPSCWKAAPTKPSSLPNNPNNPSAPGVMVRRSGVFVGKGILLVCGPGCWKLNRGEAFARGRGGVEAAALFGLGNLLAAQFQTHLQLARQNMTAGPRYAFDNTQPNQTATERRTASPLSRKAPGKHRR